MAMAIALFRGPAHTMEWCDEAVVALATGRCCCGMPAREAFTGDGFLAVLAALDEAYLTHQPVTLTRPLGTLVVLPRIRQGRLIGVAGCLLLDVSPDQPGPRPRRPRPALARRSG